MNPIDETLKIINKYNLIVGGVYIAASLFARSLSKTVGMAFGVILMTLNFMLISYLLRKALLGGKIHILPFVLYILKFAALLAATFLILRWDWVNKLFFFLGTTVILSSLIIVSFKLRKI